MRSIWRTLTPPLRRDLLALSGAILVVGTSFGTIAVAAGLPWWMASLMSVVVFAGGSQFMVVGVVAAGGGLVTAVLGALLLNARHLPFGLAIGPVLGRTWPARLLGSHLLIDESVAFAMAQSEPRRARAVYWAAGLALFVSWNIGCVAGAMAGQVIGDPDALGLDAAFPAALLALVLPALRETRVRRASLLGAGVALAATPFLPPGVPVLLALVGLVMLVPTPTGRDRAEAAT
ncbi:branched-chain amino acid permease [Actinophytocola xinjiangensis]|uniref:Branched-chain amino acid permease n=1 Tax=Actinophytocola xinjiangensis TaxID=485602 RepID=A0A7Z1B1B3_9PSEU|nr:AzlC family ABC transporter permease [Actinophytocola xinjiangensis]OLF13657.1 branched-chain amino acid permease [Actinophytocola xinjiangensis]